jgi:hypothetical protein
MQALDTKGNEDMSWRPYEPLYTMSGSEKATIPVTVSLNAQGARGTGRMRMKVVVRTELLDGGLPFWNAAATVSLLIGADENAGSIRIVPRGPIKLRTAGGRLGRVMLSVPAWPELSTDAVKTIAVEYDHSENFIEIDLPACMLAKVNSTATKPAPSSTAAGSLPIEDKKSKPFTGLGSTGPHPHPAMQRPATRTTRS